jgi:ubiquinone/menaquinone biosynthesis C-methylase UbiE
VELTTRWRDFDAQFVRRRYDRLAGFFVVFEWLFLLPPGIRRKTVERMGLKPGSRALEIGCGTGRNLSELSRAVGSDGRVYGVDLSEGMLGVARRLCDESGLRNVSLAAADAAHYAPPEPVDAILFSLSYAVMPHHREVLRQAWRLLKPGGYLVIMDAKVPSNVAGRLVYPLVWWASRLTVLGNPDVRPWDDLAELTGGVEMEELSFGTYYICRARKP